MRRPKPSAIMFMAPLAVVLLLGLSGCVGGYYDGGYYAGGPEWDGTVVVGGVYGGGYRGHAFRPGDRGHPVNAGSSRGRASMGARGGGHAGGGHR